MPYTMENPPESMKNRPTGLLRQWIAVFNRLVADGLDEDSARMRAWGAVKKAWKRDEDGNWKPIERDMAEILDGVEILRAGTHTESSGTVVRVTVEDLDRIAGNCDPDYHEAPVVLGHPADNRPAYGWVESLRRDADRLKARLRLVPDFLETVRRGLYKKRSASIYLNLDGKGMYLRHVGFLGAVPPAVMDGRMRPQHAAWHNTVLRHDDPWWRTHYPLNGWGCRCTVVNHSGPEVERMKAEGEKLREEAPEMDWQEKEIRQSDGTKRTVRVPNGIDPGWAYNVGETAWGRQLSEEVMDAWRRRGAAAWERMTSGDRLSYGRPRELPLDITQTSAVSPMQSKAEAEKYLQGILGGDEKIFMAGADLKMPVLVNARSLSEHIPLDRSAFLPFFPELIQEPYEVWLSFEKHKGTGKVVLRARFLKAIQLEKGRGLFMSAQTVRGMLEAWTFFTSKDWKYLEIQRRGLLMFGR